MSQDACTCTPPLHQEPGQSVPPSAELESVRKAIWARARQTVDPQGTGFDPFVMSTDDSSTFLTDDMSFKDWLDWVQQIASLISLASARIGLGIIAAGGAIAASNMFGNPAAAGYATATLAVSAAFAAWFVGATVGARARGR